MSRTRITCGHCGGTGHAELSSLYEATLQALRKAKRTTGAQLARKMGCTNEAMCNRLRVLEGHGLAIAEPIDGREIYWSPAK